MWDVRVVQGEGHRSDCGVREPRVPAAGILKCRNPQRALPSSPATRPRAPGPAATAAAHESKLRHYMEVGSRVLLCPLRS